LCWREKLEFVLEGDFSLCWREKLQEFVLEGGFSLCWRAKLEFVLEGEVRVCVGGRS
jgi:hypothetical protein